MPFNIGPFELLLVLVLALLVLGPGKLPEVGSALGRTIRDFRKASTDIEEATSLDPPASPSAPAKPATIVTAAAESDAASEDRTAS
jgi:sec-independent protein translocase protein TatA